MVNLTLLTKMLDSSFEWLAVRPTGAAHPLRRDEVEIETRGERVLITFPHESGYRTMRIVAADTDGAEIEMRLAGEFGSGEEDVRWIPRGSAESMAAEIEAARLAKAGERAAAAAAALEAKKVVSVALNSYNSRLAQIILAGGSGQVAVLADVTDKLAHETLLASAFIWLRKLGARKKFPIDTVHIAVAARQARALRKLIGTLGTKYKRRVAVIELKDGEDGVRARVMSTPDLSDLWREKPTKLRLPSEIKISKTAEEMIRHAPDKIDVIVSGRGETLRFRGLPFARVRSLMGKERAWFGLGRERRPLTPDTQEAYYDLLDGLHRYRDPHPPDRRHEMFRLGAEAWLESILRRNVKLLDANLVLSPIYNQFRTSTDKIDLLALRNDGRLVIIELKCTPDRETVFQAADYWRKIELQRRKGELAKAGLFEGREILDRPALVYVAAPALSFHRDFEEFARMLAPEIEMWRWELHEDWREDLKVIGRRRAEN